MLCLQCITINNAEWRLKKRKKKKKKKRLATKLSAKPGPSRKVDTQWRTNPAGTWCKYNVASTSMQRHDVASTLRRRYIYVMCLPGRDTLIMAENIHSKSGKMLGRSKIILYVYKGARKKKNWFSLSATVSAKIIVGFYRVLALKETLTIAQDNYLGIF